ncbi:LamG-like jellyroll fold domain-containing protein [Streptomyces nogalater]
MGHAYRVHLQGGPASRRGGTLALRRRTSRFGATLAKDTATEGTGTTPRCRPRARVGPPWGAAARTDYSLWLNDGSDDTLRSGYAATSTPAVNTKDSFTVSSWVYLTDASQNRVVLSAPGSTASAFTLYYSTGLKKWVFNRVATDVKDNPVYLRSVADAGPPPLKVWTHRQPRHQGRHGQDQRHHPAVRQRPPAGQAGRAERGVFRVPAMDLHRGPADRPLPGRWRLG